MVKTDIKETTEYYDENGKLTKKEIREEHTEDDTIYYPYPSSVTTTNLPWVPLKKDFGDPMVVTYATNANSEE